MLYVLARSLRGGQREGLASSLGTAVGGFGHVIAAAFGLSIILATSATAFHPRRIRGRGLPPSISASARCSRARTPPRQRPTQAVPPQAAFRQGITTEVFNPKTALFFLSFLPQFINRDAAAIRNSSCSAPSRSR